MEWGCSFYGREICPPDTSVQIFVFVKKNCVKSPFICRFFAVSRIFARKTRKIGVFTKCRLSTHCEKRHFQVNSERLRYGSNGVAIWVEWQRHLDGNATPSQWNRNAIRLISQLASISMPIPTCKNAVSSRKRCSFRLWKVLNPKRRFVKQKENRMYREFKQTRLPPLKKNIRFFFHIPLVCRTFAPAKCRAAAYVRAFSPQK